MDGITGSVFYLIPAVGIVLGLYVHMHGWHGGTYTLNNV